MEVLDIISEALMTVPYKRLLRKIYKITSILCDNARASVTNFCFSQRSIDRITNTFNIIDNKERAAEIINSTEIDPESQENEETNFPYYFFIEYAKEQLLEIMSHQLSDDTEITTLNEFNNHHILDVEFDNELPTKIRFNKLSYPIFSLAFLSVIQEVRFGDMDNYIYKQSEYLDTKEYLSNNGYSLPENVYQTHYFFAYLNEFLPPRYINDCFVGGDSEDFSGVFKVIDMLQQFNSQASAEIYNSQLNFGVNNIDKLDKETLDKMMADNWNRSPGPCRDCITVKDYHCDGNNTGILYNKETNKYLGAYETYDDNPKFFRSVPDYINSKLSEPHTLLLLAIFRTYINDNHISMDDGVHYEIIKYVWDSGVDYNVYVTTTGYDWDKILELDEDRDILATRLGIPANEIGEEHAGLIQGWRNAIPW